MNAIPAIDHELTNIGMIGIFRVLQNINPVVVTKAVKRFVGCKLVQLGKRKYFTGALIGTGFVEVFTIDKFSRDVGVMTVDGFDYLVKFNRFWCCFDFTEQCFDIHYRSLVAMATV